MLAILTEEEPNSAGQTCNCAKNIAQWHSWRSKGAERMYSVHAKCEVLPCSIVSRRRLVGRSDRYRIQTFEILARFGISLYVLRLSPRLSDGRGGGLTSNVPCLIEVVIRDLVVFGLDPRLFSPRRLRGLWCFLKLGLFRRWSPIPDVALTGLKCLSLSPQAPVLPSQFHHTYAILFHRIYQTPIPQF